MVFYIGIVNGQLCRALAIVDGRTAYVTVETFVYFRRCAYDHPFSSDPPSTY